MVEEPAETAVTNPTLLMVATDVFEEIHGLTAAGVAEPVSADVSPTQADNVPVIVGSGFTSTEILSVPVHPLLSVTVYVKA